MSEKEKEGKCACAQISFNTLNIGYRDLHMLLHPKIVKTQLFKGSKLAVNDKSECTKCEIWREKCRFNVIKEEISVESIACEGCGVCTIFCPESTIILIDRISGYACMHLFVCS
ncbi:hypothetical protein KAW11_02560 [Candidatus Bathyarchaeota archaeon]|nr:hypothetical protein [Candidatus Bathyarchaeota archaeon]